MRLRRLFPLRGIRLAPLVAALVATSVMACQSSPSAATSGASQVDQNRAVEIARAFVVAGQPSGYVFLELTNQPPEVEGTAWRIKVDAHVRIPQSPPQDAFLHFIIDVDRATGTPTIYAQG